MKILNLPSELYCIIHAYLQIMYINLTDFRLGLYEIVFKIYLAAGLIYYKKSIVAELGCNFLEDTADRKKTVTEFKSQIVHKCQPVSFPLPA